MKVRFTSPADVVRSIENVDRRLKAEEIAAENGKQGIDQNHRDQGIEALVASKSVLASLFPGGVFFRKDIHAFFSSIFSNR